MPDMGKINNNEEQFICIQCGCSLRELYKKFSNSIKPIHCGKCHKIADKYIEFESIITLLDCLLLSEHAFRHILYNSDFKLQWKLSLVLLLLESFALWRHKRSDTPYSPIRHQYNSHEIREQGFYISCLQNIADYAIMTLLLLILMLLQRKTCNVSNIPQLGIIVMKAIAIANFSKLFLLPIMVWRENTTEFGTTVHHLLVMGHHLLSLVFTYAVVSHQKKLHAFLTILPAYLIKQYLKSQIPAIFED